MSTFTMDPAGLKKLDRFFKGFPNEARKASAGILNSLAFTVKKYNNENINREMTVRNKGFVKSSLIVQMANQKQPALMQHQVAYSGSINRPRFTGWKEQQEGTPPRKKRGTTRAARGGSKHAQMRHTARMRGKGGYYNVDDYKGKTRRTRYYHMMRIIGERGGGTFILGKTINIKSGMPLPRGLWHVKAGKLELLQYFGVDKFPKKIKWMSKSITNLRQRNDIQRIWGQQINRIVRMYNK